MNTSTIYLLAPLAANASCNTLNTNSPTVTCICLRGGQNNETSPPCLPAPPHPHPSRGHTKTSRHCKYGWGGHLLTMPLLLQSSSSMMCSTSLLVGSRPSSLKKPWISAGVNTPLPPVSTCHSHRMSPQRQCWLRQNEHERQHLQKTVVVVLAASAMASDSNSISKTKYCSEQNRNKLMLAAASGQ